MSGYRYTEMHWQGWTGREQPKTCGMCRGQRVLVPYKAGMRPVGTASGILVCTRCDGGPVAADATR